MTCGGKPSYVELRTERECAVKNPRQLVLEIVLILLATLLFSSVTQAQSSEGAPVFKVTPVVSKITFYVKSSVDLEGTFEKWDATLAFTSTDASTGVLDIKIQADSVKSGSQSKDKKLKGEHCFDVEKNPYIMFHSTKITQTSPNTFDVSGTFTLRGISKPEALTFTVNREAGGATGEIKGILTIDRRDFGLGGGIKFVTIADRVDVTIDFRATRVGPPLVFKQ
jgi:polyisoprenoid-binding protein YceI